MNYQNLKSAFWNFSMTIFSSVIYFCQCLLFISQQHMKNSSSRCSTAKLKIILNTAMKKSWQLDDVLIDQAITVSSLGQQQSPYIDTQKYEKLNLGELQKSKIGEFECPLNELLMKWEKNQQPHQPQDRSHEKRLSYTENYIHCITWR